MVLLKKSMKQLCLINNSLFHSQIQISNAFKCLKQKTFYTRIRIRVSQLAKIPTLFPDLWRLLNQNKKDFFLTA